MLKSLPERWGAIPGWDSYNAKPASLQLVVKLLNVLSIVIRDNFQPPQVTALADGGMQAEWHRSKRDLEIVVSADEPPAYYFFDHATGAEEEATLDQHSNRACDLIGVLS